MHILMSSKTENYYNIIFIKIINIFKSLNINSKFDNKFIMAKFEKGLRASIKIFSKI